MSDESIQRTGRAQRAVSKTVSQIRSWLANDNAISIIIQTFGQIINFIIVVFISYFFGLEDQGKFSSIKNFIDIISSLMLLGLPQGYIYGINKKIISSQAAFRISIFHSISAATIAYTCLFIDINFADADEVLNGNSHLLIALALGSYTFHGLCRGIALPQRGSILFSVITITPAIGILLSIFSEYTLGSLDSLSVILAGGVAGSAISLIILYSGINKSNDFNSNYRDLLSNSFQFFLQTMLISIQPFIALYLLRNGESGYSNAGAFTLSLVSVNSVNSLIGMIAPLLFNSWSQSKSNDISHLTRKLLRNLIRISLPLIAIGFFVFFVARFEFDENRIISIIFILALSIPPLILTRILSPALMAGGRSWVGSITSIFRVSAFLLCAALLCMVLETLYAVSVAWVITEYAAAALLVILVTDGNGLRSRI
jgi:O-antigen/teichoic acid export membrane protein